MDRYKDLCFLFGAAGVACAVYFHIKIKKIANKVDLSIEELSSKTHIDIERAIVDKAIQKTVDREIEKAASYALTSATETLNKNIREQVKQSVSVSSSEIKKAMSNEITRQITSCDMYTLKKEVVAEAKKEVAKKLDGCLDEALEDFNTNLENVSKIYSTIASSVIKEQEKGPVIRFV